MDHAAFIGRTEVRRDSVSPLMLRGMAATLGVRRSASGAVTTAGGVSGGR